MDMDAFLNNPRRLYKDDTFWLVVAGVFSGGMFLLNNIPLAVFLTLVILFTPMGIHLFNREKLSYEVNAVKTELSADGILVGYAPGQIPVVLDMEIMNHMFVIGMTRYGKTRLIMSLIAEFITDFSPDELKLAFSDAKAVSFNVFGRSKHLFAPIAKSQEATENLIELILEEMHRRLAVFSEYHEEICTNLTEYQELSGERLPRIVVIFDEVADSIEMNSQAEKNLTTLAKMGLAAGIHLILITQRPTKVGISNEITSQCQTILSTYMRNQVEYGSVAKIPEMIYSQMRPEKGLFMMFNPDLAPLFIDINPEFKGWAFVRANYMSNEVIKELAVQDSTTNLELPALESSIPAWAGSEDDKLNAIGELEKKLGEVTPADMKKYFGVSGRTAGTWLQKYYNDR